MQTTGSWSDCVWDGCDGVVQEKSKLAVRVRDKLKEDLERQIT
jgi:hypothetical protein